MSLTKISWVSVLTPFHDINEGEIFRFKDNEEVVFVRIRDMLVDGQKVNSMSLPFEKVLYFRKDYSPKYIFVHHAKKVNLVRINSVGSNSYVKRDTDGEVEKDYTLSFDGEKK